MRRCAPPLLIVALLAGAGVLLVVSAVPGLRHRHAGGVVHSHGDSIVHSHGDGPVHAHPGGHDHDAHGGRDGWHIHLTLFGFELTLWESSATTRRLADRAEATNTDRTDAEPASDGVPVLLSSSPISAGWFTLFWIDAAPVPGRVAIGVIASSGEFCVVSDDLATTEVEAPPVPPPETV